MGLLSRFRKKAGDPISTPDNELFRSQFNTISANLPLQVVNAADSIRNGYLKSDTVFSVVNKITALGNGVVWDLMKVEDKKAFRHYDRLTHKEATLLKYAQLRTKALTETQTFSSIEDLIRNPNLYQSMQEFWNAYAIQRLVTGNAFVYGLRRNPADPKSPIISLHVANTAETQLITSGNFAQPIKAYRFNCYGRDVRFEDVWHSKAYNPDWNDSHNGLIGKSPLEVISNLVAVDVEGVRNQADKFANDGVRGIITGVGDNASFINTNEGGEIDALKKEYYRQMNNRRVGTWDAVKQILFHTYQLQFLKISQTAQEMDTVSTLNTIQKRIWGAFNAPFIDDPKYSNGQMWRKDTIINALLPIVEEFKMMLNKFLLESYRSELKGDFYIDYDMIASFPELQDDLATTITALNSAEFLTINEKRDKIFAQRYDDPSADKILVAFGKVPIDELNTDTSASTL